MWRTEVSDEGPMRKNSEHQCYQGGVENILDMMNNYARKKYFSFGEIADTAILICSADIHCA